MIDIHCHLTYKGLDEIKDRVIEEARNEMDAIITCGYPDDFEKALEVSQNNKGFVYLTLGIHPIHIIKMSDKEIDEFKELVIQNKDNILAVGEIGLDYHWIKETDKIKRTKEVFIDFLELSKELKLPVVLHTRKAEQGCFDIVTNNDIKQAIFHSYSGNMTLARQIIEENYFISLTTTLMGSKNTKKIAQKYPLENLFTETDSPFLSPYPDQKINVPQNVRFVLERMSELREMKIEEIDKIIMQNSKKVFNLS